MSPAERRELREKRLAQPLLQDEVLDFVLLNFPRYYFRDFKKHWNALLDPARKSAWIRRSLHREDGLMAHMLEARFRRERWAEETRSLLEDLELSGGITSVAGMRAGAKLLEKLAKGIEVEVANMEDVARYMPPDRHSGAAGRPARVSTRRPRPAPCGGTGRRPSVGSRGPWCATSTGRTEPTGSVSRGALSSCRRVESPGADWN